MIPFCRYFSTILKLFKRFPREGIEIVSPLQFPIHAENPGIAAEIEPEPERESVILRNEKGAEDLDRIREGKAGVNDALSVLGFDDEGGIPRAVKVPVCLKHTQTSGSGRFSGKIAGFSRSSAASARRRGTYPPDSFRHASREVPSPWKDRNSRWRCRRAGAGRSHTLP